MNIIETISTFAFYCLKQDHSNVRSDVIRLWLQIRFSWEYKTGGDILCWDGLQQLNCFHTLDETWPGTSLIALTQLYKNTKESEFVCRQSLSYLCNYKNNCNPNDITKCPLIVNKYIAWQESTLMNLVFTTQKNLNKFSNGLLTLTNKP